MFRNSNPWSPWLSQHVPGVFAHPDAPEGGSGFGFSRDVGPSGTDLYGGCRPDPYSMDGRDISPQKAAANYALYEVERSISELSEARSAEALLRVIEAAFGSKSFSEGFCQAQRNAPESQRFLELQRQFAQAELYDHLTNRVSWPLGVGFGFQPPALWQVARWLPYAGFGSMACSVRLKKPAENRDTLLKELTALFTKGDGALAPVKTQLTPQTQEHWARYVELAKRNGILSRGESGWFLGKVMIEVLPLIATQSKAAGFAAKLKGVAPQLLDHALNLASSPARGAADDGAASTSGAKAPPAPKPAPAAVAPVDDVAADRKKITELSKESLAADKAAEKARLAGDSKTEAQQKAVSAAKLEEARSILRPHLPDRSDPNASWAPVVDRLDVSSPKDKAVFWSGDSAAGKAFAEKIGGTTLETTPGGHVIDNWSELNNGYSWDKNDGPPPWAREAWAKTSQNYSSNASGNVHVVQKADRVKSTKTIWHDTEKPVLRESIKEGTVTKVDMYVLDGAGAPAQLPASEVQVLMKF